MYETNRPFYNSILAGIVYFIFAWSIDSSETAKGLFAGLMMFLPGLTFPLTTTFPLKEIEHTKERRLLHVFLSLLIYHGCVWLFSGEGHVKGVTILAGTLGSLGYLVSTKLILKYPFTYLEVTLTVLFSGLAFLPYEIIGREGYLMGVAILVWTLANGYLINEKYKTTSANIA